MGVYIAPDIKDRVAVGDDLYQIADSGGKKKLTPDPTSVSEVGTAINKALLQPIADALQAATETLVPYEQYWWRRRPTASGYSETKISSAADGAGQYKTESHTSSGTIKYYVSARVDRYPSGEDSYSLFATLQYADSISINQSTGAISLNSPTTYTVTESDSITSSAFYGRLQGKYVKGFVWCTDVIFYIPLRLGTSYASWELSDGESRYYYGYEFTADSGDAYTPQRITAVKNTSMGSWETVSSLDPDAYPKTGTSGGYDWVYVGQISDLVGSVPDSARAQWKTINVTTASFSGTTATITIPCKMALVVAPGKSSAESSGGIFGVIDTVSGTFYGLARDSKEYTSYMYTNFEVVTEGQVCALIYGSSSGAKLNSQVGGFNIYRGATTVSVSLTLYYLPLDSLEEGK